MWLRLRLIYVMSDSIILVDFGASRIKAAQWSLRHRCVLASCECAAPTLKKGSLGEAEGHPEHYWQALEATAGQIVMRDSTVEDLWLCSEMHGFMLALASESVPLTPYISWQDERILHLESSAAFNFNVLRKRLSAALMHEAGLRLRPGLPLAILSTMGEELENLGPVRFLTLVDWLLVRGGESKPISHPTLAAGTGLYSIRSSNWSDRLARLLGVNTANITMCELQSSNKLSVGTISLNGRSIRVWGGLGDLQAAAHGMGFPRESTVMVNLGTGSQVMAATSLDSEKIEIRPCVTGELVSAVTHIPSGRALNTYASFIDECALLGGGEPIFWRTFLELDALEIIRAEPCIDLNVFSSSWRYIGGGRIPQIMESSFTFHWFMCALARSWLTQYAEALSSISDSLPGSNFLLGGGLSRRALFIPAVLGSLLKREALLTSSRTGEETLDGLLRLAEASR